MNTSPIIFDIETGPEPEEKCTHLIPEFTAPSNYKDEAKIAANIAEQRQAWLDRRALSSLAGNIIAIGLKQDGEFRVISNPDEGELLTEFWDAITSSGVYVNKLIGFCSNAFDVPFMAQRSWLHGVAIPQTTFDGRYLNRAFIDLADYWKFGSRHDSQLEFVSTKAGGRNTRRMALGRLANFFGLPGKNGDGAHFYKLWEDDRDAAIAYLENDLFLTEQCARFMGVIN